jgi:DNA mismatch repair protein MutL
LRSTGTESGHVTEIVESAALSRPQVTFSLTRDGRQVREFLRAQEREERVRQVCSETELSGCRGERGPLRIEAFLSRPEAARTGAGGLSILVNERPVRDRALAVTIAQAYGSVLERGRYPRGVVFLDLPTELLDVNVHPQKSEVRFADPRAVSDALYGLLSRALAGAFSLPTPSRSQWGRGQNASSATRTPNTIASRSVASASEPPHSASAPALAPVAGDDDQPWQSERLADPANAEFTSGAADILSVEPTLIAVRDSATAPIRPAPEIAWASLRFVAQLKQMYLLCESSDGIYLLDQHAAAERVTFTRLRHEYQSRAVSSQSLLFPISIDVTTAEAELVEQRARDIAEVGLDVRVRGPESVSIHAVPKLLQRASAERLVRDLLGEVSRRGGRGFSDAVDLALATMACHGSVRAGDPLIASEVQALLGALDEADFAGHCPHGRPIVTFLSWGELERKVGRR